MKECVLLGCQGYKKVTPYPVLLDSKYPYYYIYARSCLSFYKINKLWTEQKQPFLIAINFINVLPSVYLCARYNSCYLYAISIDIVRICILFNTICFAGMFYHQNSCLMVYRVIWQRIISCINTM